MQPDPIRVIAFSSLILGSFFVTKSISGKTPKYVLHELLSFKVNKSRFFRKYISQRLESVIGFMFLFFGFALLLYLEVQALGDEGRRAGTGFDNWWLVISITVVAMLGIALVLSRITRFFSNKVFVEHVRFMVVTHGFPLESDEGLVLELGRVMRVRHDEEDTVESYSAKVRAKMGLPPGAGGLGARGARPASPMTGLLVTGAAAAYALSAWIYFRGRFGLAALLGALFAGLMAPAAVGSLGGLLGAVAFALLAVAPGIYLAVHVVDAKKGLFLLPTIYSIPIAFVCGLVLWVVVALGAVL